MEEENNPITLKTQDLRGNLKTEKNHSRQNDNRNNPLCSKFV